MNIKYYLKSIKKRKIKTWLTLFSIAIGISSVLIIGSISNAGKNLISHELDSLGVNGITIKSNDTTALTLNNEDLECVKKLEFVEKATPVLMNTGYLKIDNYPNSVILWGISEENEQVLKLNILSGRNFSQKDVKSNNKVCLLDSSTAKSIFPNNDIVINRNIELLVGGNTVVYKVIGVVESDSGLLQTAAGEFMPNIIYLPYTTLQNSVGNDELTQISLQVVSQDSNINNYGYQIKHALKQINDEIGAISIENMAEQKTKLMGTLDIVSLSLSIIGIISLFVSGLGTMTVMLFSISERTKEIGIKKSIGARGRDIVKEFICETIILSFLGTVLGITFSVIILFIASIILHFNLTITINQVIMSIAISLIFGIVFGIYPAIHASRLNPVDALRRE